MKSSDDHSLLEPLLDAWDRNNTILVNLLHLVPEGGLDARALSDGHTVGELFAHMHYVRLAFVEEDAPEFARPLPDEWVDERDPARIERMLNESAQVVRDAVSARLAAGRELHLHNDHPILLLQHMIWHEGYHHGQIKLALKVSGRPIADQVAGRATWGVWMRKTK